MERQKMIVVVLIVAISLAGAATYSIYRYLQAKQQEVDRAKADMTEIIVAAEEIPLGSSIEAKQLKKVLWPKASVPPGAFTDPNQLIGRTSASGVLTGEPLMETRIATAGTKAGVMAYIIPEGSRAMTVAVNDVAGVAGFILPNSTVDVVVTATTRAGDRISKIVLQNLKVLAIGQKMEEKEGKAVPVPTVTLSITPEESEKLALASNVGTLQLLLRGTKDTAAASTSGAQLPNLIGGGGVSKKGASGPRKAVAASVEEKEMTTITVIRGGKGDTKRSEDSLTKEGGFWNKREVAK